MGYLALWFYAWCLLQMWIGVSWTLILLGTEMKWKSCSLSCESVFLTQEKAAETKDCNAVPKALAYKDGLTYKQHRPVSAGGNDPMNRVKSSKGPKVEQAFFYTGPNKSDVGMWSCSTAIPVVQSQWFMHSFLESLMSQVVWTGRISGP